MTRKPNSAGTRSSFRFSLPVSLPVRAAAFSLVLAMGWTAAVNARQTTTVLPQAKPLAKSPQVPSSPANGKTALPPGKATPPNATAEKKLRDVILRDFILDQQTGIGIGHNFIYKTGDTVITGDNARYDKNQDILDADSHLVMDDPQHHMTGDKSHVERKKGLLNVVGNVVLTMKPDPSAANDKSDNVEGVKKQGGIVTCDQVDSYYKKKFHILRGHLVFKQHILRAGKEALDRTVTAEHAEYDAKNEVLVLFPPVRGEDSDGTRSNSDKNKVIIGTKAGQEKITGAEGEVVFKVEEETGDDDTPPSGTDTKKTDTKKPDTPSNNP